MCDFFFSNEWSNFFHILKIFDKYPAAIARKKSPEVKEFFHCCDWLDSKDIKMNAADWLRGGNGQGHTSATLLFQMAFTIKILQFWFRISGI